MEYHSLIKNYFILSEITFIEDGIGVFTMYKPTLLLKKVKVLFKALSCLGKKVLEIEFASKKKDITMKKS